MSPNEGNLDSIQSYDSEILTAGAMQKTINSQGNGELHEQILKFKNRWPRRYTELFEACGWHISPSEISYKNLTGRHLKEEIRKDFSATSASGKKENALLGSILYAISSDEYIELQVVDFIDRLRLANSLIPSGHSYEIHHYLRSNMGRALILDHHINRPNYVARDFGAALSRFYLSNPRAPKDPRTWGSNHQNYENAIISDYGVSREMTDATGRYNALEARI
ncbi:hypothetical protein [Achromobacter sp.]|uniref:hypothetical protein n=1 Tax=Achromobacter sp. TaxID=134375 RepID=UPI00289B5612|nr:hypothetical protein [Achromobacter sp.]